MRVECERCHALVAADFDVDPDGVTVSCGACGATFRAEARRRPLVASDLTAGPGCVKCGAPMTDDPACPRCGLSRDRAQAWAAADAPPAPELTAAWAAVDSAWDDPAVHDRAAAIALGHGALPWLARRYRDVQRARPTDAVARARIDRVGFMTLAALKATAKVPQASRNRSRVVYVVVLVVIVVIAGALLAARATTHERSGKRRPAIPAAARTRRAIPPPPQPQPEPEPELVPYTPSIVSPEAER